MSPSLIFPSFDKALGGAHEGRETTGELVEEIPPHHEIAEITEVPKLKTKLGCAISQGSGARTQPQQTG